MEVNTWEIYYKIKAVACSANDNLVFNPQKYYISIKTNKNIAFIKGRNKKVGFIVMMPEVTSVSILVIIRLLHSRSLYSSFITVPVQLCISNLDSVEELTALIERMIEYNQGHCDPPSSEE